MIIKLIQRQLSCIDLNHVTLRLAHPRKQTSLSKIMMIVDDSDDDTNIGSNSENKK